MLLRSRSWVPVPCSRTRGGETGGGETGGGETGGGETGGGETGGGLASSGRPLMDHGSLKGWVLSLNGFVLLRLA